MEKIKQFKKALNSLDEALNLNYSEIVRDSVIKRFEYTFDLAWKSIKQFLYDIHGIPCNSPKHCFRKFYQLEYFIDKETEIAIEMVDDRNSTVHTYFEKLAEEIYTKIKNKYLNLFKKIFKNTK